MGDIVIIEEDNLVTTQWPLACIERVTAGIDGTVRVVHLRNKNGTYTRPVTNRVETSRENCTRVLSCTFSQVLECIYWGYSESAQVYVNASSRNGRFFYHSRGKSLLWYST